jgi:hypothetical protein
VPSDLGWQLSPLRDGDCFLFLREIDGIYFSYPLLLFLLDHRCQGESPVWPEFEADIF